MMLRTPCVIYAAASANTEPRVAGITRLTEGLEVQRHHLATNIPEELRHVVGAVHPCSFRVDSAQLILIVSGGGLLRTRHCVWGKLNG